jgi:hypothetical protein
MTIEPTDTTVTEDLTAFENEFFGVKPTKTEVSEAPKEEPQDEAPDEAEELESAPEESLDEDNEQDDTEDEKPDDKPKKKNRFQERIDKLKAEAREAKEALEALKAEKAKPSEPAAKTPVSATAGEPTPDDKNDDGSDKYPLGEFDPKYIRDLARHTIDKEWAERTAKEQEAAERAKDEAARNYLQEEWTGKVSAVAEQYDDFLEKTLELEDTFEGLDPQFSDYLVQTIKSLSNGPEVLYYFANNIDEAKKFVKLGPLQATLALGEYNALFKGKQKKETRTTKAPVPPQLNKGATSRVSVRGDTDDLDAFSQVFFKT